MREYKTTTPKIIEIYFLLESEYGLCRDCITKYIIKEHTKEQLDNTSDMLSISSSKYNL